MKKLFLSFVLCSFAGAIFAQGVRFGITAGLNVSNITRNHNGVMYYLPSDWKAGFQGGFFVDYALSSNLSLIPEILITQKGYKSVLVYDDIHGSRLASTKTLNYLQLPINFAYKFDIYNGHKLFPFAGIYLSYGLSGTLKVDKYSYNINFGSSDNDDVKALDYGVNFGIGYEFEHFILKVQYNHGLAYMIKNYNYSEKNKNFAVTVGYMF